MENCAHSQHGVSEEWDAISLLTWQWLARSRICAEIGIGVVPWEHIKNRHPLFQRSPGRYIITWLSPLPLQHELLCTTRRVLSLGPRCVCSISAAWGGGGCVAHRGKVLGLPVTTPPHGKKMMSISVVMIPPYSTQGQLGPSF